MTTARDEWYAKRRDQLIACWHQIRPYLEKGRDTIKVQKSACEILRARAHATPQSALESARILHDRTIVHSGDDRRYEARLTPQR